MNDSRIVFLPVPENFREKIKKSNGGDDEFIIRSDIPLPVEIHDDGGNNALLNLSLEMILSGMLRVIEAGNVKQAWIDYYSSFVLFLRPDILAKLKDIKVSLADESFSRAYGLIQEGKAEEALKRVHDFLERHPLVWNGWFLLGWALRILKRWTDGEAAFRKALELGGDNSDTRNELAICLMETGNIADARGELEAALSEDPKNVKIISNLGVLAARAGEKDKAAAFFRTVLEIDENDPVAKEYLSL